VSVALWIVVGVGALISLTGLIMCLVIWWKKDVRYLEPTETEGKAGVWDFLMKVLDVVVKFTPKAYRLPVALMLIGALVMVAGLAVGAKIGG
jgi:hypothetical protein